MYTWSYPSSDANYIAVQLDGKDLFDVQLYEGDINMPASLANLLGLANSALHASTEHGDSEVERDILPDRFYR